MSFYNFGRNTMRLITNIFFKIEIIGMENIPKEGRIILAANHKSNWDPLLVAANIKHREVSAIAKKELFKFKPLGYLLTKFGAIGINRDNPDVSTIKAVLKVLKEDKALGLFPEGTRYPINEFGEGKAGVAMFAVKGKADVIPISIVTNYKLLNKVIIYIDKPISFEEYYKQKLTISDYERLSNNIMHVIEENYNKLRFF